MEITSTFKAYLYGFEKNKGLSGNENQFSLHLHLHLMADKFGHTPNGARTMALLPAQPTFHFYIFYV